MSKPVQVIARYEFKSDPRKVVYLVRSSNGKDEYETSLFDGKAVGCNKCPAHGRCYHKTGCEALEAKRVVVKVGDTPISGVNADHAIEKAIRLLNARAHAAYDVIASAEQVASSVSAPKEESKVVLSQDCPDMSVREHLIEEETGRYERNMRHPHTSLDDLKSYALREQLDVKIKRGAGTYKEQYIRALLSHQRQKLEAKYQESAPQIEAPSTTPQAPKFESRDLAECGTLNRNGSGYQGFRLEW